MDDSPPVDANAPQESIAGPRTTLVDSFGHAFAGFGYVVKTQRNMRIHLLIAAVVVVLGLYLKLRWTQWAVLGLTMGSVLVAEMFNTVAEAALDVATPYYHPLIKIAKDVAAGAVLVASVIAVLVGLLVMAPPLWATIVNWFGR
jgi:diacylglycerol kinase